MVRYLFSIFLCLLPLAGDAQGVLVTPHTGLVGGYSAELRVSQHPHFSIYAQGNVIRRGHEMAHTVFLRHGLGDGSILYIDEAWSFGRQLDFHNLPPDRVCGGMRCLYNVGILIFSRDDFHRLAQSGIELQLVGSEGPITLFLPAEVFAEAAAEAATLIR